MYSEARLAKCCVPNWKEKAYARIFDYDKSTFRKFLFEDFASPLDVSSGVHPYWPFIVKIGDAVQIGSSSAQHVIVQIQNSLRFPMPVWISFVRRDHISWESCA